VLEREAHDLFGIKFTGNKHLKEPLFLPDDYKGKPPFLKENTGTCLLNKKANELAQKRKI
jgi:NADH:ubiquinone oxidoreductase subunit C